MKALLTALAFAACGPALAGSMPDPAVTPGEAYYTDRLQACAFDRSTPRLRGERYREVAQYVFELYGIPYSEHRKYELDHLIPRCIGGADEVRNLWPQPLSEAKIKDGLERRVCRAVCNGREHEMSLEEGQQFFTDLIWEEAE